MAVVTKTIGTAGGRDYSNLTAWAAALPANLVTDGNSYVASMYNDGEIVDSTGGSAPHLNLAGFTTDATHNLTVTAAAGQAWCDNTSNVGGYLATNGVAIRRTDHRSTVIECDVHFTTISRLQLSGGHVAINVFADSFTVTNCILEVFLSTGVINVNGGNAVIANNFMITNNASNGTFALGIGHNGSNGPNAIVYNTIVRVSDFSAGDPIIGNHYGWSGTFTNNACFGFTSTYNAAGTTGTNNGTDQSSVSGSTSNQVSLTYANQFNTTTNTGQDFRLKNGNSLAGNGITYGGITTDAYGTARPGSPAIGAFEPSVAASTVTIGASVTVSAVGSSQSVATASITGVATMTATDGSSSVAITGSTIVAAVGSSRVTAITSITSSASMSAASVVPGSSNIHYNLTAWSASASVTTGNRRSSNGQAWQALGSGTTGSTAPIGTANVSDGTITWKWLSHIDFTSLGAWWTAQANPLTQTVTALLWNNGVINDSFVIANGGKTTSTNKAIVTCAAGESFVDYQLAHPNSALAISTTNGVYIQSNASFGVFSATNGEYLVLNSLQIHNTNTGDFSGAVIAGQSGGPGGSVSVNNCILSTDGYMDGSNYGGLTDWSNCLCIITGATANVVFNEITSIRNCTIVSTNGSAVQSAVGQSFFHADVDNCIIVGFLNALYPEFGGSITSKNNIVSGSAIGTAGTGGGSIADSGSQFNVTASSLFRSPGSDYRILNSSLAFETGSTISGLTTDILNTIRPQYQAYDVGCFEIPYVASAQWPIITWLE